MKKQFNFKYTQDDLGREVHKYKWSILLLIIAFFYIFNDTRVSLMYRQSIPLFNDDKFFETSVPIILFLLVIVFTLFINYIFNWFEVKSEVTFFRKFGFFSKLILDALLTSFFYFIFSYFFFLIILSVLDYYIFGTGMKFSPILTFLFLFLTPLGISTYILTKAMKKTLWAWGIIYGIVVFGLINSMPNLNLAQGIVFNLEYLNIIFFILVSCGFASLWQVIFEKQQHVTGYDFETTPGGNSK
ncbi:hypothetical protein KAU33_03000 [Candidatus Dependentiae bacterium]|nr:hypothetical protein [Candidatus Dependentiae bacterium]